MFDPIYIIISREEVERCDISAALNVLSGLIQSAETVRFCRNRVDIAFHGYDSDPRELFEIPEVRDFVVELDTSFPYWLYFLTKEGSGLQAIAFCFLPPHLTEEGRREIWPRRLVDLVERRWGPALYDLAGKAGHSQAEADAMFTDAGHYFLEGPRRPMDPNLF